MPKRSHHSVNGKFSTLSQICTYRRKQCIGRVILFGFSDIQWGSWSVPQAGRDHCVQSFMMT